MKALCCLWRVVSVEENKDTFGVTAVAHNPSKYNAIELDRELTQRDVSILMTSQKRRRTLMCRRCSKNRWHGAAEARHRLAQSRRANKYHMRYRLDNDNATTVETSVPDLTIQNVTLASTRLKCCTELWRHKTIESLQHRQRLLLLVKLHRQPTSQA